MTPAGFRFPVPSPVKSFRMITVLTEWQGTAVSLPGPVLWALALNVGDTLAVTPEAPKTWRFYPEKDGTEAVGPDGALELAGRFEPGEPLVLLAESGNVEPSFTLARSAGRQAGPELSALALYWLRVEPGYQVRLPADALWALSLSEGSSLAGRTVMWTLEGGPAKAGQTLDLRVGPGGVLPLPEALQPGSDIRFEISVSRMGSRFRLEPSLEAMNP